MQQLVQSLEVERQMKVSVEEYKQMERETEYTEVLKTKQECLQSLSTRERESKVDRAVPELAAKSSKRDAEEELDQESSKRQKTGESSELAEEPRDKEADELPQEELQQMMIIVPEQGMNLYDSCGVHHMSTEKGIDIYMLVEKEYPLSRGTLTLMLVAKLLVEQDNEISRELLRIDLKLGSTDEVVHKELGDSLVRVATTASSLEAEQDSGGGPWCQETIRDTIAQTKFESVSKHSNNLLLARGNTLQSDKDRLKLNELMTLCTTLQNWVLDLEKTKTTQHNEIASLKRRVKKLEKKDRLRIHRLKRLYKVGLTARVESSDNEEILGEDAPKQGRIDAIDADEEITLVSVHDVNVSAGEEVFATTVDDITLAQVLEEMKSTKPKKKGVVIQELVPMKPMNKKDLIRLDVETALNLQAEFNEEERLAREKAKKRRRQYCLD
ncbi:hypothetical protein Tco_0707576 [Tanacetum coccineum]|uniref:Uncharacterized protein n=1 Tax=Tanacetum coccineum TaxID=301880 RepID=A0ABQ4YBF4_9ASTR